MLKNIEIKAFKDFMAKSRDKLKVTNRQSVYMRKYECHWNRWSQKSVRLVELESEGLHKIHPMGKFVQNIGSQLIS